MSDRESTALVEELPADAAEPAEPVAAATPLAAAVAGLGARLTPGILQRIGPIAVPGFRPRLVRLYLPREFDPALPHPLLVLFDGQNLFGDEEAYAGGWHVDATIERLARRCGPRPVVLGIDHGGTERIRELSPFPLVGPLFRASPPAGQPGLLNPFLAWVTHSLLATLAAELPLPWLPSTTFIGGSSMGGLAALYAHFLHPNVFGGALAMSPALWLADRAIFGELAQHPNPPVSHIYLDAGGREDHGRLAPVVRSMADRLRERGWGPDRLYWRYDLLGTHSEASWRRRLPRALRFLVRR